MKSLDEKSKPELIEEIKSLQNQVAELRKLIDIGEQSEKRLAETMLRESEDKYRALFESSPIGIVLINDKGFFESSNSAVRNYLGYSEEEFRRLHFTEVVAPEFGEQDKNIFEELVGGKRDYFNLERRFIRKDGTSIWMNLNISAVHDEQNNLKYIFCQVEDISKRRKAEDALKTSEVEFRALINAISESAFLIDRNYKFIVANNTLAKIMGKNIEDLKGINAFDTIPSEIAGVRKKYLDDVYDTAQPVSFEDRIESRNYIHYIYPVVESSGIVSKAAIISHNITEQKKAENELKASEERFRMIIESSPNGITIIREGKIVFANITGATMFGYDGAMEIIGRDLLDAIIPEQREAAGKRIHKRLKGIEQENTYEYVGLKKDGSQFPILIDSYLINLSDGPAILLFVRDITEQRNAEKELRESEEKYRSLFEHSPIGVTHGNLEGGYLDTNPALQNFLGYSNEEFKSIHFSQITHPDDLENDLILLKKEINKELDSFQLEKRFIRKDGKIVWGNLHSNIVLDENGEPKYLFAQIEDITTRKLAEEALRESEEKYRNLIERAQIGLIIVQDGILVYANNWLVERFGYTMDEMLNTPFLDFVHPDERDKIIDIHLRRLKGENVQSIYEMSIIRKDGGRFYIEANAGRITYNGKPAVMTFITDITESKRTRKALKESEKKFRGIFENANDGILIMKGFKFFDCNQRALDILKCNKEAIIGKQPYEISPEYQPDGQLSTDKAKYLFDKATNGTPMIFEWNHLISGKLMDMEVSLSRLDIGTEEPLMLVLWRDITERKTAEKALKESEENYRRVFNNISDGILITDTDGKIVSVNPAFLKILKYKNQGELIGRYARDTIYVGQKDRQDLFSALEQTNNLKDYILNLKTADSKIITVKIDIQKLYDEGEQIGLQGTIRDITEKIESEKIIKEKQETINAIIESSSDWIWEIDADGKHTYSNPAVENTLGYSVDEIVGKNSENLISDEDKVKVEELLPKCIENKEGWKSLKIKWKHKDGTWRILESNSVPIIDEDSQLKGFRGVDRDVTERVKAEEELREQEVLLKSTIESIDNGILVVDQNRKVIIYNNRFNEIWGLPEKIINTRDDREYVNAIVNRFPDPEATKVFIENIYSINKEVSDTFELKDGSIIDFLSTPLIIGKQIKGRIFSFRDITDKRSLELERQLHMEELELTVAERTKELREINKRLEVEIIKEKEAEDKVKTALKKEKELGYLKSRFISTASHEFRTPLTTILSSVGLLEIFRKKGDIEKYKKHLEKIKNSIKFLTNLIEDLLTIEQTETSKIGFNPELINLFQLSRDVFEEITSSVGKEYECIFKYRLVKKRLYFLDKKLMVLLISNLVSNAIKYSPGGGKVGLDIYTYGKTLKFKVSDDGIGIDDKDKNIIFEQFQRGSSLENISGSGLGLSIVKNSVDLHGGTINFKSRKNKGTEFIVTLPIID